MKRGACFLVLVPLATLALASAGGAAPSGSTDLRVLKSDSPDPVRKGQTLSYVIRVENLGPLTATGVKVTDTLPKGVDVVSVTAASGQCARRARKVTCELADIPFGANYGGPATVTILVVPRQRGSITNAASVRGGQRDPVPGNDSALETTRVLGVPNCRGVPATIIGTAGDDTLVGSGEPDVIVGLGGSDTIRPGAGRDLVCAGGDRDFVAGGSAADRIFGGGGQDHLLGGRGPDLLDGGAAGDSIEGNGGSDRLRGGAGVDGCSGGPGADLLHCERTRP
jgi:uncharacterized repeat protein (TIGR01451 family)